MEVRPTEVRPAEVRRAEVRPAEVRPAEVRRAEVRPAEVRPAEIGLDIGVLLTPRVPGIHTLPKLSDVLVIRHVSSSTRLPTACHRLARLVIEIETYASAVARGVKASFSSSTVQGGGKRRGHRRGLAFCFSRHGHRLPLRLLDRRSHKIRDVLFQAVDVLG